MKGLFGREVRLLADHLTKLDHTKVGGNGYTGYVSTQFLETNRNVCLVCRFLEGASFDEGRLDYTLGDGIYVFDLIWKGGDGKIHHRHICQTRDENVDYEIKEKEGVITVRIVHEDMPISLSWVDENIQEMGDEIFDCCPLYMPDVYEYKIEELNLANV